MNPLAKAPLPTVKYTQTPLGAAVNTAGGITPGGLDLTTPSLQLMPGALRDVLNFELAQSGGYSRIEGYERVDGRAAPSAATYLLLQVVSFTNVPTVGQTVTQATSGASGKIIAVVSTGTPYIAVTQVTGTFDYTHALTTPGPVAVGTVTYPTVAPSALLDAQYTAAAADVYRALIGAVPGSGAILGVVGMAFSGVDNIYAFRANLGGTAVDLYKASAGGWVQVPFFKIVSFTAGGTAAALDGDVLTQGGVTATIKRVVWASGAWSGTAAGQFVITNPAGGNFAAGAATAVGSGATVTLSGVQTAITMAVGGHFEFVKCNFSGQLVTRRIYGCDGVNKAFEFDGTTLAPITTGLTTDAPNHIAYHKAYLWLSYASSIFHSGPSAPFQWSAVLGGGEIATGDAVTGMISLAGDQTSAALAIFLRGNTSILYGVDPTTFNLVSYTTGIGTLPYSSKNMFDTFVFDDLGVITLKTSLNYGNFASTTLTKNILPFVVQERNKLIASSVQRNKGQYRVFFTDGYGLWLTMVNQQYFGATLVFFPSPVFCCDEADLVSGDMATYFGSSDGLGYVYQMDKGTSFDGANIDAYVTLAWDAVRSPRIRKRFRAASIEVQGSGYAAIQFSYLLGYGTSLITPDSPFDATLTLQTAGHWDSMTWDAFTWDGINLTPTDIAIDGTAENIQVTLASTTNYMPAFTLNSIIYHYNPRRGIRV